MEAPKTIYRSGSTTKKPNVKAPTATNNVKHYYYKKNSHEESTQNTTAPLYGKNVSSPHNPKIIRKNTGSKYDTNDKNEQNPISRGNGEEEKHGFNRYYSNGSSQHGAHQREKSGERQTQPEATENTSEKARTSKSNDKQPQGESASREGGGRTEAGFQSLSAGYKKRASSNQNQQSYYNYKYSQSNLNSSYTHTNGGATSQTANSRESRSNINRNPGKSNPDPQGYNASNAQKGSSSGESRSQSRERTQYADPNKVYGNKRAGAVGSTLNEEREKISKILAEYEMKKKLEKEYEEEEKTLEKGGKVKVDYYSTEQKQYIEDILVQKSWLKVLPLKAMKLEYLQKNYPLNENEGGIDMLSQKDKEQYEEELKFIRETVVPKRNQLREKKTDFEILMDARYFNKYGDYLIKRFSSKSLYERLGLKPPFDTSEIKKAYHKMALVWHPDATKKTFKYCFANEQNFNSVVSEVFKLIDIAYRTLTNNAGKNKTEEFTQKSNPFQNYTSSTPNPSTTNNSRYYSNSRF